MIDDVFSYEFNYYTYFKHMPDVTGMIKLRDEMEAWVSTNVEINDRRWIYDINGYYSGVRFRRIDDLTMFRIRFG